MSAKAPDAEDNFITEYRKQDVFAVERAADAMPKFQAALLFRALTLSRAAGDGAQEQRIAAKLLEQAPQSPLAFEAKRSLEQAHAPDALSVATLRLKSEPFAVVTIDGLVVGITPLDVHVQPARYRIAFSHPGYMPYTRDLELAAGIKTVWAELESQPVRRRTIPERDATFFANVCELLSCTPALCR